MKFFRYAIILVLLLQMFGCVTYRDRNGNLASQSDDFDCKQKCGYYDSKQSGLASGICFPDCMQAKGFSGHY